jgi:P27 family predicted phage terminase small subunit
MPRGSGRRPLPTAEKKVRGNPGKRKLNENEPHASPGEPPMPKLSVEARREWKRIVPELLQLGVLTVVDGKALAGYCHAYARWQQAEREVTRYGLIVREPVLRDGKPIRGIVRLKRNPAVTVSFDAQKIMKSFLVEFGMTPSSRSRLSVLTPLKPDDRKANPAEKYFSGFDRPGHTIQ